jgi:uncharacterized membrane protein YeaQ/YmgE (transglycosylase-associated protein family)
MEGIIAFIILGALGGLLRVLLHTESLLEALSYNNAKWVLVGAISGLAYYFLYVDYGFPNSFMAIVVGYTGADFIDAGSRKAIRMLREALKP